MMQARTIDRDTRHPVASFPRRRREDQRAAVRSFLFCCMLCSSRSRRFILDRPLSTAACTGLSTGSNPLAFRNIWTLRAINPISATRRDSIPQQIQFTVQAAAVNRRVSGQGIAVTQTVPAP